MRKLRTFASWLLLAISPILVYPQNALPQVQRVNHEEQNVERDYVLSYDDMLQLIDQVESGELENRCTFEESEKVRHFVALLAKEGALPDESLDLDDDIEELLNGEDSLYQNALSFVSPNEYQYLIVPAVLRSQRDVVLCKSWLKKQWKHVKHFVKKHKKELIIGAAVVVATAVVVVAVVAISASTASAAAAGAAGAAGASASSHDSDKKDQKEAPVETPTLKSAIDNQTTSFKDNVVQHELFKSSSEEEGLSSEEKARILGSLSAHGSLNTLQKQIPFYPELAREIHEINSNYTFSIPGGENAGHPEIDRKFSTDCGYLFANPGKEGDFNALAYQVIGEKALEHGYYNQAVQNLEKAIEINPTNPASYLSKGVAHFGLGQYDNSLEDYKQFTSQAQTSQLSVSEFSLGLAKGLPKGVYESGEGMFLFLADFATHPVQSAKQMADSVSALVNLVRNDEWGVVAEALSPEMHQLVTQWESLPSDKKGELAGYALGKHGADILVPGALAKIVKQGVKSAQELAAVCKNIQMAQETLILETAAGIANTEKIAEVVKAGQKTAFFAEELGISSKEMAQLNETHKLRSTIANKFEHLSPSMQESFELHKKAQVALKPYVKKPLPESQVRELIHKTGIPTFPKPAGVPENYIVTVSDKGAGIKYIHPQNNHTYVRVMPGKLHSPLVHQQQPYVNHRVNGKSLDKHGNIVLNDGPKAHIPIEEFVYREAK